MAELSWIAEVFQAWIAGASWAELSALPGFKMLTALLCFVIGPSLVAIGVGLTPLHETWWGKWMGAKAPDDDWTYRAGDLDKDGLNDF